MGREKERKAGGERQRWLEYRFNYCSEKRNIKSNRFQDNDHFFTSTFPLLAHKKQSTLGVTGTEVSRLRPPASHTFSTSWSLLKSTVIRCTPSQGALDFVWPLVEGVLSQFKVLLLGGLAVSGFLRLSEEESEYQKLYISIMW